MAKFGFYEYFKDVFAKIAGDKVYDYKVVGYSVSSACAEFIADALLCPWEAAKVRMQTSQPGTFPTRMIPAINKIIADEGTAGLYKGLTPLWGR
jgi:solute carrier family 25 phosphate transporter 3